MAKSIDNSSIISQLGAVVELDNRDNVFTPNKGMKAHFDAIRSDNIFGSDYDFWRFNYYLFAYKTLSEKLVGGWRLDGGLENIGGDILFGGAAVGNDLDHLFDFRMATSDNWDKEPYGGHFVLGETYTTIMNYVNPTTSHHAANGSYYIATGTFYLTDEQPAPSSAPGIPEPSSLALVVLGLGAVAATRRSTR